MVSIIIYIHVMLNLYCPANFLLSFVFLYIYFSDFKKAFYSFFASHLGHRKKSLVTLPSIFNGTIPTHIFYPPVGGGSLEEDGRGHFEGVGFHKSFVMWVPGGDICLASSQGALSRHDRGEEELEAAQRISSPSHENNFKVAEFQSGGGQSKWIIRPSHWTVSLNSKKKKEPNCHHRLCRQCSSKLLSFSMHDYSEIEFFPIAHVKMIQ